MFQVSGHVAVVSRRIERDGMEDGLISLYIYLKLGSDCISLRFDVEYPERDQKPCRNWGGVITGTQKQSGCA